MPASAVLRWAASCTVTADIIAQALNSPAIAIPGQYRCVDGGEATILCGRQVRAWRRGQVTGGGGRCRRDTWRGYAATDGEELGVDMSVMAISRLAR